MPCDTTAQKAYGARRGKRSHRGRKAGLAGYSERWHVERMFARVGTSRRVLVRYERHEAVYLAFVAVAAIFVSLRRLIPG